MSRPWTEDDIKFLAENYPLKGRAWTAIAMGRSEAAIRHQASVRGVYSRGSSDIWHDGQIRAAATKLGRKRPDQSIVMKRLHAEGKLLLTPQTRKKISLLRIEWLKAHDHPRGMKGKNHTEATKAHLRIKSTERWLSLSQQEKDDLILRRVKSRLEKGGITESPNKSWKGGWRNIGGTDKYYRSRWEANYARYLQWLKENGYIKEWKHEPHTFWFPVKRGCVSYLPDFLVTELDGEENYHEVKGWMDPKSITKLRRMEKYYPEVKIMLIEKAFYKSLKNSMARLIPGWES